MAGAQVALILLRRAPAILGAGACQRVGLRKTQASHPLAAQASAVDWGAAKSPFLGARQLASRVTPAKMATAKAALSSATKASQEKSPPAKDAYQEPTARDSPKSLDVATLQQALNAVLLSDLAYKTPQEVEYLRIRATGKTHDDTLKAILDQAGGKMPKDLQDKLKALQEDADQQKYTYILKHCAEPSQYFDGRHGLFLNTTEAYVLLSQTPKGQPNVLYCVFRGTSDKGDELADVEFAQVQIAPEPPFGAPNPIKDIKDIMIHRGFRDQFVAISTALTRNVEAAAREVLERGGAVPKGEPKPMTYLVKKKIEEEAEKEAALNAGGFEVVVTGHSLGAALATIGAFVAALEHPGVKVSYFGFGSPRVGNKHFVDAFDTVLKRGAAHHFANEHDVVTGIPGAVKFCHVPGGIMLREEGDKVHAFPLKDETSSLNSALEWITKSEDFVKWYVSKMWTKTGIMVPWSQHEMSKYVQRVQKLLQQAQQAQAQAGK